MLNKSLNIRLTLIGRRVVGDLAANPPGPRPRNPNSPIVKLSKDTASQYAPKIPTTRPEALCWLKKRLQQP